MNNILFKITYTFIWLFALLPFRILYIFSDITYLMIFYIIGYRKKVVFENLRNSFPEKTEAEIKKIAKGFYSHLCDNLIETIALIHMNEKSINKRMKYENIEILNNLYDKDKNVIVTFGHYCTWDWTNNLPLHCKHSLYSIYMPIKNKKIDKLVNDLRIKFGFKMLHKQYAVKQILNLCRTNEKFITIFIGDQTPSRGEINYWTKFLNQDTAVFLGTERIAKKTDQAVVFFDIDKVKRGYYKTNIILLFENPKETAEYEITEAHLRFLEKKIINKPEYWLWSHRRWKFKKNEN